MGRGSTEDGATAPRAGTPRLALGYAIMAAAVVTAATLAFVLGPPEEPRRQPLPVEEGVAGQATAVDEAASISEAGPSPELSPERLFGRLMLAIAVAVLAARAAGALAGKIGQPQVIGEILAGILLGPTLLGALLPDLQRYLFPSQVTPLLSSAADIGLAFYMFLVGLELDPRVLRGRVAQAAFISNAGVLFPLALGIALAVPLRDLIGPDVSLAPFALFLGVAMSVTAFPVLARILMERRMLRRPVGAVAMASAAVDDVSAWFLLAIVTAIASPSGSSLAPVRIVGLALLFSAGMALVIRRIVGRVSEAYDEAGHVPGSWVAGIFVGVLASAYVASWIGVAAIFGAFVMGLIMPRRADLTRDVTRRLEDFVGLVMLPLFFVVTGLRVDLGLLDRPVLWAITLALLVTAVVGKWVGVAAAARFSGFRGRDAMALGALMNTRGLTELIVLTVGLNHGVISPALFTMLVIVALATTLMTGPALRLIDPRGDLSAPLEDELLELPEPSDVAVDGQAIERSLVVAAQDGRNLDALVALAEPLARSVPPREVILTRLVQLPPVPGGGAMAGESELAAATRALQRHRERLVVRGIDTRAMACLSADCADDLVRLAGLPGVDLVLIDGRRPLLGEGVPRGDVGALLERAPCNVVAMVNRHGTVPVMGPGHPVAIPFAGEEHDRAALELGTWIASANQAPVRVLDATDGSPTLGPDAEHSRAVPREVAQAPTEGPPEVVRVSSHGVAAAAADAGLVVMGVSERWPREPLGPIHAELARTLPAPVLLVRPGSSERRSGPTEVAWPATTLGPGRARASEQDRTDTTHGIEQEGKPTMILNGQRVVPRPDAVEGEEEEE